MLPLIPLLLEAASLAPALMKFVGAGSTAEKVATDVAGIAGIVAGTQVPPEERLKVIAADAQLTREFQIRVTEQMQAWDAMFLADTKDARDRDVRLAQAGFRNNRANWLVIFAMLLVVGLITIVLKMAGVPEWVQGVILFALGRAWGYLDQIYNFEFGTTKQSAAKDGTIADLSKQVGEK